MQFAYVIIGILKIFLSTVVAGIVMTLCNVHVLTCKKGGYVSLRNNSLRDGIANIMLEVCNDVVTEPTLLPTNPNNFNPRVNTAEETRLDVSARGINSTFERSFFDVRVTHPFAISNVLLPFEKLYNKHETEKMNLYEERVQEVEKGSFSPLVFLTAGGIGMDGFSGGAHPPGVGEHPQKMSTPPRKC